MTPPGSPVRRNGNRCASSLTSSMPRPMKRFTEYTVRDASVKRRRSASRPTSVLPCASKETIEGSNASPCKSRMTDGAPFATYATRLLVVPRSMPTTWAIEKAHGLRLMA